MGSDGSTHDQAIVGDDRLKRDDRQVETLAETYLELIKGCLTRSLFPEKYRQLRPQSVVTGKARVARIAFWRLIHPIVSRSLSSVGLELVQVKDRDRVLSDRAVGIDWPADAETMIGHKRLDNLHHCIRSVIADGVQGDFIETGVWRGGACIFMRACLKVYGDKERTVWVADSFEGLPKPSDEHDAGDTFWTYSNWLAISLEEVQENFRKYGLLDQQVRFLKGWFKDTLPSAPIERISIMRLDGDMYQSTMDAITALYPKLSVGGYCIIDDYQIQSCREAVHDYRERMHITEPIREIDWTGVYWQKTA